MLKILLGIVIGVVLCIFVLPLAVAAHDADMYQPKPTVETDKAMCEMLQNREKSGLPDA